MFRVVDDRPGSDAAVTVARPGPLRVYAHVPASADAADLTGLRVLLITDVLQRAAELGGLQVLTTRVLAGRPASQAGVERAADALGAHPPLMPAMDPSRGWPGGPHDVHVTRAGAVEEDDSTGILVRVADARLAEEGRLRDAADGTLAGHDPIAVRLALMSVPRHHLAELTSAGLADAQRTVTEWRRSVADWAQSPSRRIPEPIEIEIRAAFDALDTVTVLSLLTRLAADEAMPPGARFEAFAYADRVLGLDLPRDIGR